MTEVFEPMASVLEKLSTAQMLARQIEQLTTPVCKDQVPSGAVKDKALATFTVGYVPECVVHGSFEE